MLTCPSCGTENPEGAKFCNECGTKLEATPIREERKVITALFCNLVGSTALGERLDAEDISRLLRSYQAICRRRIESHGGVIEKFIGDAVVGVFGVPLAHEDDPERAVRAALRIIEDVAASDLGIEVRLGVNTGEALVRLNVDPRSGEGFATGDTMNTAARLEAAAPVMGVAVGAFTYRASAAAIAYEELPSISAKGKADPVPAWRALHPTARVGIQERDRTPFVGRDLEFSMLTELFDRSRSRPSTEFVTIVGEPGLGKSRLVRELARHVDASSELVTWRDGKCLPYGDGISFWALGEIVKAQAGILETDDQETLSSKLDQAITDPDEQTRTWIKDRLAPLVGLDTSAAPPQQEEAFAAWRRFLESLATRPTVLVVEDLHWADNGFVAFLEHLAERTAGLPLLVVVTARPELEERHPSWPPGEHPTVLSLTPLAERDLGYLVAATLPDATPELTRIVLERAGGSPLFAEQLAAMLLERALPIVGGALDETMIPSSVQALIAARIDGLPAGPKQVLMEASVVGKTFWAGAIACFGEHADLESTLSALVRRQFCRPVLPSSMEGDSEFGFWHALVRDVAYGELTKAERARMHADTARWIAGRTGAVGESAEIIAHHLDVALELARWAPEIDTEAIRGLLRDVLLAAGRSVWGRGDVGAAVKLLGRATEMLPRDHQERVESLRLLGAALRDAGDWTGSVPIFDEAVELAAERGDSPAEWRVMAERFDVTRRIDQSVPPGAGSLRLIEDRIPLLEAEGDHFGLAKAWRMIALISWDELRFADSERATAKGVEEARLAENELEAAEILAGLALSDFYGPTSVGEALARGAALLEELRGNIRAEAFVLAFVGGLHGMQGSFEEGQELLDQAAIAIQEAGIGRWSSTVPSMKAYIALLAEDPESAELILHPLIEEFGGDIEMASLYCQSLTSLGRADEAVAIIESIDVDEYSFYEKVHGQLMRADVNLALGQATEAKIAAERAVGLLHSRDDAHLIPESKVCLALAERDLGNDQRAQRLLAEGVERYSRKGNVVMAGRTRHLFLRSDAS